VKLLLDTHVVLWWRQNSRRLTPPARDAIGRAAVVWVSAASAWEVAIKSAVGRLQLEGTFESHVEDAGFDRLPITFAHAAAVGTLPPHHADPFDRMLVAQARVERLVIVTHDPSFRPYDVQTLMI
jgi:PIN domain nuclease of toxin-antitoxin system